MSDTGRSGRERVEVAKQLAGLAERVAECSRVLQETRTSFRSLAAAAHALTERAFESLQDEHPPSTS